MTDKADKDDTDHEDVAVLDEPEATNDENPSVEDQPTSESEQQESDDVVVSIGEEAPPPEESTPAPEWVRELRKSHREAQRKIREYETKLQAMQGAENKPAPLSAKPKLEDFDYDSERYEKALEQWYDHKRQVSEAEAKARAAEEEQAKAWQSKLDAYGKAKADLKVKDYDDAEEVAQQVFSTVQQGVILQGAENPALLIYALGKNPKKAKELASLSDPVKFAFAVAKLEKELKVTPRKPTPAPERVVNGDGPKSGTVDSQLERLRAEAEKTGNYSKVFAYKQQLKRSPR
jgi:hypothetical protein